MGISIGVVVEGAVDVGAGETVAAGAAAAGAGTAAAGGGSAVAGASINWGAVGLFAAKTGASFAVSYGLANLFNKTGSLAHPDAQSMLGNGYSSLDPIPVLYGQRRIGGSRAVVAVRSSSQQTNDVLIMVLIWGEGALNALKTAYFDSVAATDANGTPIGIYSGYMNLTHHLGADDQAADPRLVGSVAEPSLWNANCTFAGIAYTRFELGWTPDRFPNGRPTVTVDYEGRKVYDPRNLATAYSRNPALAIRDYLTSTRYGCRVPQSMIDDAAFAVAADVCDELVPVPDTLLATLALVSGGSGYQAGETIVLAGGVATRRAEIVIDTVDGGGAVLTFHISEPGMFTTISLVFSQFSASSHQTGTDSLDQPIYGSGSGATFGSATFGALTQARYLCDGVVNVDQAPMDNMRALLMSCRGFLVFSGGQYKLRIDRDETIPGAYWGYDFSDGEARQFAGGTGLPLACTRAGATGTAFDSSGTLQVIAANTLRLDFNPSTLAANGLLIEEARANGIRNNVAAGAVAGSPGTQPTNWNMTTTGGVVTRTIVGVGVESGIDYIDVRYQFSAAGTVNVIPEGSTTIVAANGQTWAASSFLRVVGGSLANLVARMAITGRDNTGVQTEATTTNCTPVPTGAGLATQRYAAVRTFNVAGTVFSLGFLQLIASAAADVTVRVGLQQTERCTVGGSMSSVIRTTGAAATRNIDRPSFAVPATLNTSEGSVVIAWKAADDPAGVAARVFYIGDGTDNERIMLYVDHSADRVNLQVVDGGVTQASINLGAHVAGSVNTAAISWKANDISGSLNGAAAITDTVASIPTLTQFDLGHQNGANSLNGDVLDVAYIRRALSDSELVSQSGSPFVLDEDNIIGSWQIQLGNKHNRFNRVKARFFNEASGFNPDLAVWPTVDPITGEDPVGDAYRALDGGIVLETVADLPFTTDLYRAQQICQVELKRSRFNLTVSLVATIDATRLEVGDVVPVSHATPGWPAAGDPAEGKLFRVIEIELLNNDEVRLVLLEYNAAVYDLDDVHQVVQAQLTSLPDATSTVSPGTPSVAETLYETTGSAGVKSRATVTWGAAADVWVVRGGYYELEYKLTADTTWARISPLSDPMVVIPDLAAGRYDFRVRAVNVLGTHSAYSATTTKELFGLTTPPSDPANFAAQAYADHIKFTWDRPTSNTDLDVVQGGRAFIRWSPRTSGATWNDGSLVNFDGYAPDGTDARGPLQTGTYFLKFRDSSGNYSVNAASFVVTEALLTGLSTLATITESPTFTGAKTSVVALDGVLKLDGTILWDSIPGNIDDWGYVDSSGVLASSGSYAFASKMDLGSVKNFRLFATIRSLAFDTADNWDARINNIDDWGTIDGDVVEDAEATLLVRVTNDDPNATPTWGPWHRLGFVADYNARGCDFRLDFVTATVTHNRQVDQLVVTAKQ